MSPCLVLSSVPGNVLGLTPVMWHDADGTRRSQLPKVDLEDLAGWSTWAMRKTRLDKLPARF